MKIVRILAPTLPLVATLLLPACAWNETAKETAFEGLTDMSNKPLRHINTTKLALHWVWGGSLWGDASLEGTVKTLCTEAKDQRAKTIRIAQSDTTYYWWVLPPISFLFSAQTGNAAADVTP